MGTPQKVTSPVRLSRIFIYSGYVAITAAIAILVLTFLPVIIEELGFRTRQLRSAVGMSTQKDMTPVDSSFGIIIPKLGANARIIANVDPYDGAVYQKALARGVAHAKGTAYPGQAGNVFLFSHSSVDFYRATQFNSVFYLLAKLEKGDQIDLYYQDTKYTYHVSDIRYADPGDVSYMTGTASARMLTLMTCWPPGTTFKRLIVIATVSTD